MSGIIAVYGLVVSVLISGASKAFFSLASSYTHRFCFWSQTRKLLFIRWIYPPWRRAGLRIYWVVCRICHWSCRRFSECILWPCTGICLQTLLSACEHTSMSPRCLWRWYSFSSLPRCSDCTGQSYISCVVIQFLRPYHAFQTYHCPDNELKSRRHQNLLDFTVNLACLW